MNLKELRKSKKLTQVQASEYVGVPLRTYKNYENDSRKIGSIKYNFIVDKLNEIGFIDETHGIQTIENIKEGCESVFSNYDIEYCYLYGSYAKDNAKVESDIDLLVSSNLKGLAFLGLVEDLREALKKKVEVIDIRELGSNNELINEILRDGIKVYG